MGLSQRQGQAVGLRERAWAFGCPVRAQLFGYLALTSPVTLYFALSKPSRWQASWGKQIQDKQCAGQSRW